MERRKEGQRQTDRERAGNVVQCTGVGFNPRTTTITKKEFFFQKRALILQRGTCDAYIEVSHDAVSISDHIKPAEVTDWKTKTREFYMKI